MWNLFPEANPLTLVQPDGALEIAAELDAFNTNKIITFTPTEPEYVWHAPAKSNTDGSGGVLLGASDNAGFPIPVLPIVLIGGWVLLLFVVRATRYWPRVREPALALTVLPVIVSMTFSGVWVVRMGFGWQGNMPPENAEEIFAALHRNVYRAFDFKTESDIYDVLSTSVAGELLDDVYNEVYQSLIMRDQGGAVARIQSVDLLDTEIVAARIEQAEGEQSAYGVQTTWRVDGMVYHWGHTHSRRNVYEAMYTVARSEDAWKIVSVEMLRQERMNLNGSPNDGSAVGEAEQAGTP